MYLNEVLELMYSVTGHQWNILGTFLKHPQVYVDLIYLFSDLSNQTNILFSCADSSIAQQWSPSHRLYLLIFLSMLLQSLSQDANHDSTSYSQTACEWWRVWLWAPAGGQEDAAERKTWSFNWITWYSRRTFCSVRCERVRALPVNAS